MKLVDSIVGRIERLVRDAGAVQWCNFEFKKKLNAIRFLLILVPNENYS